MPSLRLILGDQLSKSISSLKDCDKENDIVFMCEVSSETDYVKHHKKKIAFLFSAMRHFAQELLDDGYPIRYTRLDDPDNQKSFSGEVKRLISCFKFDKIIVTEAGEHRVNEEIKTWPKLFNIEVEIRQDDRFLASTEEFAQWAEGRKELRMELFYREMRKKHQILLDNGKPIGGKWNYDIENRKVPKDRLFIPKPYINKPDQITKDVIKLVEERFSDHFGDLEPFYFAVTRNQVLQVLEKFIKERLESFGDYQDAMLEGEEWLYHSHISFYLNCGLLLPLECIQAAEKAYKEGKAPLNSVEGFIRQILGWREFVRGLYWLKMPEYAELNFFEAKRKLPEFYWTANTKMNCLKNCVTETKRNAYAHHIQRLMVLGNFALLTAIDPKEVNEWFLIVYADAFEWVELPNVSGMVLFADGGYLASKPYASGGNYINKMSDYCKNCHYKVSQKTGEQACPFNYLYWDFLARNREKLSPNHRLGMIYRTYDKMSDEKQKQIQDDSEVFLQKLNQDEIV